MQSKARDRFSSIPKRNFRNAIIRHLEEHYKLVGSRRIIGMIAEDIVEMQKEFFPDAEKNCIGTINWRTTKSGCGKPSYGTKAEDYDVATVSLPLITDEDIEARIREFHFAHGKQAENQNYKKSQERDIETMARLIKSAYAQGGLLTGAELAVLLNRSLGTIGKYIKKYHETHDDILPTKGMILDQGSKPTHKGSIISLYEQGYSEPDIARQTNHTIEATSRYLKNYKRVKILCEKNFGQMDIVRITGMGYKTIYEYKELLFHFHPELEKESTKKLKNSRKREEVGAEEK